MIAYSTSADVIYRVARQFNASLDLDEVLGKVLGLTVEATGATRGSLFLVDEEGQVSRTILSRPNQSPEVSRRNVDLAMSRGLAGWVYRHQHGALAADATRDERWVQLPDDPEITGSALVVPLLYQDQVNGLLALHHTQVRFFDESHLALAAGIAGQAAVAVENARLFTQVKSERERLYALMNSLPLPALGINAEQCITFANQKAQTLLLVEQIGVPLVSIKGGDRLQRALQALQNHTEAHIEVRWPDDRFFNVSINEVDEFEAIVTLDDISYLKNLDAMKSQFVETVSHDLKNPLSTIIGFAQLLQQEEHLSETGQTSLDGIFNSAHHMQHLIDELLDLAKIEAGMGGQTTMCNLARIAQKVIEDFELQAKEKNMTLMTDLPPDLPLVKGNEIRLSQVVSNFVSNAIKYTPAGGTIKVQAGRDGSDIWLQVSDTGPGIPPAAQAQLFQKFYRVPGDHTLANSDGTGLGLSIVKAVVEGYGGRVWVKSQVGVGSTFGCVLPALVAAPAQPQ